MTTILFLGAAAACYFFYHYYMFLFFAKINGESGNSRKAVLTTFLLNYTVFYLLSYLGLPISFNWITVFFLLTGEVGLIFKCKAVLSIFNGLQGTLIGLSWSIISRAAAAAVYQIPMSVLGPFAGFLGDGYSLRFLPISFGFLMSGLLLLLLSRRCQMKYWGIKYDNRRHIRFANWLMAALLVYLVSNLPVFSWDFYSKAMVIWEIKIGLSVLAAYLIGIHYLDVMSRLEHFAIQENELREELHIQRNREAQLEEMAHMDILTGCKNREYGLKSLREAVQNRRSFVLCFVDLDCLKSVNDHYGHNAGDKYLSCAAFELKNAVRKKDDVVSRYGGDEFLILFYEFTCEKAAEAMKQINLSLKTSSGTSEYPFSMSVSYGLAKSGCHESAEELLKAADQDMYRCKKFRKRR